MHQLESEGPSRSPAFLVSRTGGSGLSYEQTRSKSLKALHRGVRVPVEQAEDFGVRCRALQMLLPLDSAFVGVTAAFIYDIPLPAWIRPEADRLEVAYPTKIQRRHISGIRHRQWRTDPKDRSEVDGLRVLCAARTWFDLAEVLPADFHLAAADNLVSRHLVTVGQLAEVVTWARRRRGVVQARQVLPLINPAVDSPAESRVRYWCDFHGLPKPEVNAHVTHDGDWIARGDLVFREHMVVVEYDGAVHLDERQRRYDAKRRNLIQEAGWSVVVLTADDLRDPYRMTQTIAKALQMKRPPSR